MLLIIFAFGCVAAPAIDSNKFADLNRTAMELRNVIRSADPCSVKEAQVRKLFAEIEAARSRISSESERDLLASYSNLLLLYNDGVLLCSARSHLAEFPFMPKGRMYVSQYLDPLVEKYGFPTERHLYQPTGQYWKSISEDSIKVVWKNIEIQTKHIDNKEKYN